MGIQWSSQDMNQKAIMMNMITSILLLEFILTISMNTVMMTSSFMLTSSTKNTLKLPLEKFGTLEAWVEMVKTLISLYQETSIMA